MMSRWYCVNCDNCGDAGPLAPSMEEAIQLAKDAGWKVDVPDKDGPTDLCPRHDRTEP